MRPALAIAVMMTLPALARAQEPGRWEGAIEFRGDRWPVRLSLAEDGSARLDLPALIYVGESVPVEARGDTLEVTLPFGLGAVPLVRQDGGMVGSGTLGGDPLSIRLDAAGPPPYREEEVRIPSGDAILAGTLVVPEGPGPHAAVVLLHGSRIAGRDRWEYRSWADWFARRGVAALVFDKRGAGGSTGSAWQEADLATLADDALAAARWLSRRPEVDPARLGLFGRSQAGWLAADVAARWDGIGFLALVSAPGVPPAEQEIQSVVGRMRIDGRTPEEIEAALAHTRLFFAHAASGAEWDALAGSTARAEAADWGGYVQRPAAPSEMTWWGRNHAFDPWPALARSPRPVLLLYGGSDPVVPPERNAPVLLAALGGGDPAADVTVEILPGADHRLEISGGAGPDGRWRFPRLHPRATEALEVWLAWRVRDLGPG